jgi:phosphoribosylamine--glycine ligase / phosphoribosylformylglycinamidine cyclo-ligase
VERQRILPTTDIQVGDVLLGLASSGAHSNGFSLIRKVVALSGLSYASPCPWDSGITLGRALLEPTRIYVKQILPVVHAGLLKGMSHITGGGFLENIPRVLPEGLGCYVDASAWQLPSIFRFLAKQGRIEPLEMARTFNNGLGMVIIVAPAKVDAVMEALRSAGDAEVYRIGEVTKGSGVEIGHIEAWE